MSNKFAGYHGEWNLGSPGGWEYQRMIQEIYLPAWQEIKQLTGLELELDLENKLFQPSLQFAQLLLEAHRKNSPSQPPFIVVIAEEETLEDVVENQRFVAYLNSLAGVKAQLVGPRELALVDGKIMIGSNEVTVAFMDFNTSVLVELEKRHSIEPILQAIERNIMVNPRGMEAINTKVIFEAVNEKMRGILTDTTIDRTPWTRVFYQRATTGPQGDAIPDLVQWARDNWQKIILKPEFGWSGKGIVICPFDDKIEAGIEKALNDKTYGNYIIQEFIPEGQWSEDMPELDLDNHQVVLKRRQTDFRTLITNSGLIGFVGRYGGIPTNVGSGGGVQALALIKSDHSAETATKSYNQAVLGLSFEDASRIRSGIDERATALKFTYINGPIPIALRPRMITAQQISALQEYGENLYKDTLILEKMWLQGEFSDLIKLSKRDEEIIRLQPRADDTPAMMASDGLFNFHV
jgi:hypothetical protein